MIERSDATDRRFVYIATKGYGTISRKDRYYAAEALEKFLCLRVESVSSYLDYFRATSAWNISATARSTLRGSGGSRKIQRAR